MPQLPNYLISNRKRLALSQGDVAFLLGLRGTGQISRYEKFSSKPFLESALAYQVIMQKPAAEIFGGLYSKVQKDVAARAKVLTYRLEHQRSDRKRMRRRETLQKIMGEPLNINVKN